MVRKLIYKGKILNLRVDEWKGHKREVVEHNGSVVIVPMLSSKEILMVKQYRYPIKKYTLELPAGTLDKDELPVNCAKRELEEETGFAAKSIKKLAEFYSAPGFCTEKMHLYLVKGLKRKKQMLEDDEKIKVKKVKITNAIKFIKKGKITDAKSIIGILLNFHNFSL